MKSVNTHATKKTSVDKPITEKKDTQYDEASHMISRWALGEGLFEDSRNTFKKYLEDYIYTSIDWQIEGVSFDNVQKVKAYAEVISTEAFYCFVVAFFYMFNSKQ